MSDVKSKPVDKMSFDEALAEHTANQIAGESALANRHFESLKRMLDRDDPGWRKLSA